jgi:hypothetical protein
MTNKDENINYISNDNTPRPNNENNSNYKYTTWICPKCDGILSVNLEFFYCLDCGFHCYNIDSLT